MTQRLEVTWVALECRVRQESSDEVYGTVNGIWGGSFNHKFPGDREYWDMGPDGQRIVTVSVPVYGGPLTSLKLNVTLVEHDSGNIDEYKRAVAQAVASAATAGAGALTGGVGVFAKPIFDKLSEVLVDIGNDILGTGDDAYEPRSYVLPRGDLTNPNRPHYVLRRNDDPRTVSYTDSIVLTGRDQGGDIGEYGFYFDIRTFGTPSYARRVRLAASHSGKVADVADLSIDNGGRVQQWDWWGGNNQRWELEDLGGGLWRIMSTHSGKVLDVKDMSTDVGAPIIQWDWWGGNNQKWRLEDVGDGLTRIISAHSGLVLDVRDQSTNDGAIIQQWEWWGGGCQKWRLEDS
jgi:Ricin-type beta-trefoil lectin domain-like